ncbi:MAG: metallophosphoesterase [Thermodesulfobacteriota bacterium]
MERPGPKNKKLRLSRRNALRLMVYSTIALTGFAAYAQSDNLEIIRQDVPIKGLPDSLDGFSIGVMADLHAGALGNEQVITKAVSSMQQLKPDLLTLLGDYVDGARSHNAQNIDKCGFFFEQLELLKPPLGVYGVLGNHDHWTDSKRVTQLLNQRGITVLKDENQTLANGLVLAGIDDLWEGPGSSRKTLAGLGSEEMVVLLSHNPDVNGSLTDDDPVRLILSGHTHGGQVRVPFTQWAPWVPCSPRYRGRTGLFAETEKRWGFISKGVGSFLMPMRLSCPPDIALLTLKRVKT